MIRKILIPLLALVGVIFAIYTVRAGSKPIVPAEPVADPSQAPFEFYVAGAGIVEASSENIAIGTPVAGVITDVYVRGGDSVKTGDPLFKLDDRALNAELEVQKALAMIKEQTLNRLLAQPRPEDLPPLQAKVSEAEAALADVRDELEMWQSLPDKRAVSEDVLSRRRFAVRSAETRVEQAKAALAQAQAGAWKPDVDIARAELASAQAQTAATQTDIDRLTIRALVDGQVLQRNVRPGEFAQAGPLTTPLILLGNIDLVHVRVDVDENDAWRIHADAAAVANLRGNRNMKTNLKFVRIEPFVVPKRSLTGESTERVDTRVLQVLYSFDRRELPVYIGQQMDVFIEAPSVRGASEDVVVKANSSPASSSNRESAGEN